MTDKDDGIAVTLVVADADGASSFVDVVLPGTRSEYGMSTDPLPAMAVVIRDTEGGPKEADFHPAPRRQMVITVTGRIAYTCSSGETREFGAGDIVIFDDTSGVGHAAHVLEQPRMQVFVPIDDAHDFDTTAALGSR